MQVKVTWEVDDLDEVREQLEEYMQENDEEIEEYANGRERASLSKTTSWLMKDRADLYMTYWQISKKADNFR